MCQSDFVGRNPLIPPFEAGWGFDNTGLATGWVEMKEDKTFYLETSVFPLLDVKEGNDGRAKAIDYKGTCFLIVMGRQHLFVTAKHLLQGSVDDYNLFLAYNTAEGKASYLKVEAIHVDNNGQDISFFIPTDRMKKTYGNLFIPMAPLRRRLPVGQSVFVYGFPNSGQQNVGSNTLVVRIKRKRYEGKVINIDHNCPLPKMNVVYQLELPSPRGLSGSPVMVVYKGTVAVAGYIIGQQTTNGKPIAIASDFTPFLQIEKLLIKVSQKLAPRSNGPVTPVENRGVKE